MVLQHLDRRHILMRYVFGGKAVLAPDEVAAVYIELVDGLALIGDCSVVLHLDARQAFYHIYYGVVLGFGKLADIEHQRITPAVYVGRLHHHLTKHRRLGPQTHRRQIGIGGNEQLLVAHGTHRNRVYLRPHLKDECTRTVGRGETYRFSAGKPLHDSPGDTLAAPAVYNTPAQLACGSARNGCCENDSEQKQTDPCHFFIFQSVSI